MEIKYIMKLYISSIKPRLKNYFSYANKHISISGIHNSIWPSIAQFYCFGKESRKGVTPCGKRSNALVVVVSTRKPVRRFQAAFFVNFLCFRNKGKKKAKLNIYKLECII